MASLGQSAAWAALAAAMPDVCGLEARPDELKREGGVRIMSSSLGRLSSA